MTKYRFRLVRVHGFWRCQVKRRRWFWRTFTEMVPPRYWRPVEFRDEVEAERWLRTVAAGYDRSEQPREVRELAEVTVG
jgi:hypothetical protein